MNFNQLMKQAQLMQKKVNKINKENEEKEKEFESQNGLIKGIVTGKMEIKNLTIDPELLSIDNKEILEDMLTVTLNEAVKNMYAEKEEALDKASGGIGMAGLF